MPNTPSFKITQDGPLARLKLCRPDKRNAMNAHFWREFPTAVTALSDAGKTRALIIEAEGPVFCAGLDISMFGNMVDVVSSAPKRETFTRALQTMQGAFDALENARFPVIAAIDGPCIGGAVDMIAACDLRYGSKRAEFRIEEINVGMMADLGTLQRLPKIMPAGLVKEMAYAGTTLDAERARESGLLNAVLDGRASLDAFVGEIAAAIAARPPLAITASKDAINHACDHGVAESMKYMRALQAGIFSPEDIMAAITARMESRSADFADLPPLRNIEDED